MQESPSKPGSFGPYTQSQRLPLYQAHSKKLLEQGCAYKCFCSPQRLEILRAIANNSGLATSYDGACRNLTPAETEEKRQLVDLLIKLADGYSAKL